jgi:ABC-type multidrug transport system fused ATPase/permease subunit
VPDDVPDGYETVWQAWEMASHGLSTLEANRLAHAAVRAMVRATDDGRAQVVEDDLAGEDEYYRDDVVGIGVVVEEQAGSIVITQPFPAGPAARAGIRTGDVVVAIDGEPVAGRTLGDVVDQIAGPVGAQVLLGLQREGVGEFEVNVTRRALDMATAGTQALLSSVGVAAALGLVLLGRERGLGVAELIALAVITVRLLTAARALLQTAQMFANNAPGIDTVQRLIAETADHREVTRNRPAPAAAAGLLAELRSISAGYGVEPALRDLDLTVPADGLVAITGPSGSGKSTLLDVLLGLLPPDSGELRLADTPATPEQWRSRVGYVPQQTVLVPGTVRENLTWSTPDARDDEELWEALEVADLASVIGQLPAGLDTVLGDHAALSGGEQQRLCIARAVVRRPDLLVLDEATSALDAATEQRVIDRLVSRRGAIVLATHRAALRDRADRVIDLG